MAETPPGRLHVFRAACQSAVHPRRQHTDVAVGPSTELTVHVGVPAILLRLVGHRVIHMSFRPGFPHIMVAVCSVADSAAVLDRRLSTRLAPVGGSKGDRVFAGAESPTTRKPLTTIRFHWSGAFASGVSDGA